MLVGYNTNITYKGVTYHVQTEDSGPKNPVIITLLYLKGSIIASKKINYAHLIGDAELEKKVEAMMKNQHKSMIKELVSGRYTGEGEAVDSATEEKKRSLDDVVLEFIIGKRWG
jgi:hypothetical protein